MGGGVGGTRNVQRAPHIYIYTWICLSFALGVEPSERRPFPMKTRVIWVRCIYTTHHVLIFVFDARGTGVNLMCNKNWNWNISWVGSLARSCEVGLGVVFDVEAYMLDKSTGKTSPQKEPNVFQGGLRIFAHQEYCWECTGEYSTVFNYFFFWRKFTHGSASTADYMHWLMYIIYIYPSSFSFAVLHILGLMFQPFRNLRLCSVQQWQ